MSFFGLLIFAEDKLNAFLCGTAGARGLLTLNSDKSFAEDNDNLTRLRAGDLSELEALFELLKAICTLLLPIVEFCSTAEQDTNKHIFTSKSLHS